MEDFQVSRLLPGAGEADPLPRGDAEGQGGAAAGVAVELREDDTVDPDLPAERLPHLHRFLAGHRIRDQERLGDPHPRLELLQLVHQLRVDMQAAGGVEDHDVATKPGGLIDGPSGRTSGPPSGRPSGASRHLPMNGEDKLPMNGEDTRNTLSLGESLQLLDGGGPSEVERRDKRAVAVAARE